jgi:hypothetical protein
MNLATLPQLPHCVRPHACEVGNPAIAAMLCMLTCMQSWQAPSLSPAAPFGMDMAFTLHPYLAMDSSYPCMYLTPLSLIGEGSNLPQSIVDFPLVRRDCVIFSPSPCPLAWCSVVCNFCRTHLPNMPARGARASVAFRHVCYINIVYFYLDKIFGINDLLKRFLFLKTFIC